MPESSEIPIGGENLFILVTRPGDENLYCGALISQLCRRGWPPFVMVLTDGSTSANTHPPDELAAMLERETRASLRRLGLPAHRLLMAGLFDGTVATAFDAVVRGITMVMWARDCNAICAPGPEDRSADHRAAKAIAASVATESGVSLREALLF
jgi:LmbE family N-acetylglucosaminyl deacetylase